MTQTRALTWSGKWHIVNPDHPEARHAGVALCGANVYLDDDPHYPPHLELIKSGAKSAGECKLCARSAGVRTPEQVLDAVRKLHAEWADAKAGDGGPHMVTRAYAHELAVALGIEPA